MLESEPFKPVHAAVLTANLKQIPVEDSSHFRNTTVHANGALHSHPEFVAAPVICNIDRACPAWRGVKQA